MALARHKGEILHYADELSHYLLDETPLSPEAFGLELGRGKRTEQRQKRRIAAAAAAAAAAGKERASSFARRERDAELMTKTKTPAAEDATQRMSRRLREGRAQAAQRCRLGHVWCACSQAIEVWQLRPGFLLFP